MIWYETNGYAETISPQEVTSSCAYLRKNITRVIETDPISGLASEHWKYLETKLTLDEYKRYEDIKNVVDETLEQDGITQVLDALLTGAAAK